MRVVVCGGGLGGLVLAHALREHADVVVLERDAAAADTGGYRIALTAEAVAVLERHLPPRLLRRIREVSDGASTFSQFTIANAQLRPIVIAQEPEGRDRMLCQRRVLRTLLAEGLGGQVRFAATVASAEGMERGGVVTLHDGTRVEGDLVVAAEGARSATVRSVAHAETSQDLGLIGIAGSTPFSSGGRFPRFLDRGPALAFDHRGVGMFLSLASRGITDVPPALAEAVGPPSVVWGLIVRRSLIDDPLDASPQHLLASVLEQLTGWHPWMQEQITASDPDRTAAFAFRAAPLDAPRFPWPPSRVTAVGDAVHAMPPTGGRAGSTAIRSAGALADALLATTDIDRAIADYQRRVDDWAVPAIRESLGPVRTIRALANPTAQLLAKPALAIAGAFGTCAFRRTFA